MPAPNLTSGSPNVAEFPAIVISQAIASSHPPASAGPLTAAMVGFVRFQKRIMLLKFRCRTGRHASTP